MPGRNVSSRALTFAATLSALLVVAITIVTNAASPTIVPVGRGLRYWMECVAGPMAIGAPFMTVATLMALRAFPTQPAIAGALCGASAGILADAGWRLACWISAPSHIIGSHGPRYSGSRLQARCWLSPPIVPAGGGCADPRVRVNEAPGRK
ncbi:MAG TPA: hypothetical protein VHJ77_19430 [Vicinamibacterales bacterium]|nr:hypothetical protein [Vicinamibacterales bacterium]